WNALAIEEHSEQAAVLLLLGDEEIERGEKPCVGAEDGMSGRAAAQAPAAGVLAELKLLDGSRRRARLFNVQRMRLVPGQGSGVAQVGREVTVPEPVGGVGGAGLRPVQRGQHGRRHASSIEYFVSKSQLVTSEPHRSPLCASPATPGSL